VIPQGLSRLRQRLPDILADADNGLSFAFRELLQSLVHEHSALDVSVAEVTPRLTRISRALDACQRLQEMDGIGPLNATALVAALGHGHDFRNGRQVAAWLGLVPRQYSSGGKTRLAGISKRGNSYLRCVLMHGARSVVSRARMKTDAMGIVKLLGLRSSQGRPVGYPGRLCLLGRPLRADDLSPTLESCPHLSAIFGCGQQMPSRSEVLSNGSTCRQKTLGMPR
jgi:Transposase IS116/IS110/IS902 family